MAKDPRTETENVVVLVLVTWTLVIEIYLELGIWLLVI